MVVVSVIIPTFNYANFICYAIESVLEQVHNVEVEIIVVDDGSTDDTKNVLKPFIASGKIKYFYQSNNGKASATSFAIEQCSGKYIFNLDADDLFLPDKIARSVAIFENDISIVHVASPAKLIYDETDDFKIENIPIGIIDRAIDGAELLYYFYNLNMLFGGGTTFAARASTLKKIKIPPAVDMYIDEFLILAILPFGKSYLISEALSVWRVHQNNYSNAHLKQGNRLIKAQRLLKSSDAILLYLQNNKFEHALVNIFRLKNFTENITLLENERKKKILDIVGYAFKTFVVLRPNLSQLKNYHVINRLIPTVFFKFLKGFLKKTTV